MPPQQTGGHDGDEQVEGKGAHAHPDGPVRRLEGYDHSEPAESDPIVDKRRKDMDAEETDGQ
jgi:hypothetical protein